MLLANFWQYLISGVANEANKESALPSVLTDDGEGDTTAIDAPREVQPAQKEHWNMECDTGTAHPGRWWKSPPLVLSMNSRALTQPGKGRAVLLLLGDSPALNKKLDKRSPEIPTNGCFYNFTK